VRPVIFLAIDDVLALSGAYTIEDVIAALQSSALDGSSCLWAGLIAAEGRVHLADLHAEFLPEYVISSTWSRHLTKEQFEIVLLRTGLGFVASNLHEHWTTPKGTGSPRMTEINNWIAQHRLPAQPLLVLGRHESGWNLHESALDWPGLVVLRAPGGGFSADKLVQARKLLRAQTTSLVKKSKMLARWLRHRPDAIGLTLDANGWADVAELLAKAAAAGMPITPDELQRLVAENDKQRFSLSTDGLRIRAAQGHSVDVDLKLPVKKPPPVLYHGTTRKFIESIRRGGLVPASRRDVHLSASKETALAVGARRGVPVVLIIETHALLRDGFEFRCADNGVWLIPHVPAKYLRFPGGKAQK
jgi:putative RNA 2'-phosphotransferase